MNKERKEALLVTSIVWLVVFNLLLDYKVSLLLYNNSVSELGTIFSTFGLFLINVYLSPTIYETIKTRLGGKRTYRKEIRCLNCSESNNYKIPFGTTIRNFKKNAKCKYCGVIMKQTKTKLEMEEFY